MSKHASRSFRRGSVVIVATLLVTLVAQLAPIAATEIASDCPAGVEVVTALEVTVDQPSDPSFVLRLSRLNIQEIQGVAPTVIADSLMHSRKFQPATDSSSISVQAQEESPTSPPVPGVAGGVPMFRGNAARTGEMPGPGPEAGRDILVRWEFHAKSAVSSSPAVVNGVVYVGSQDGDFYALDAFTGEEQWRFRTGGPIFSSPAVDNGIVYFGSDDKNLYALDAIAGAELWRFGTGGKIYSSPALVDGVVFVGSYDKNLYALDAVTGAERWRFGTQGSVYAPPVVEDGMVYLGSFDQNLYALNAVTGEEVWRFHTVGTIHTAISAADGLVFVGGGGSLYALDSVTGEEQWRFAEGGGMSSQAVVAGVVYVGSYDKNLYALDAVTGMERWRFSTTDKIASSPAVADGVVYVGGLDKTLYAVDAISGKLRWSFDTDGRIFSSPVVVDGVVYVGSDDKNFYAIGAAVPVLKPGAIATVTTETALRGAPAATGVVRATLSVGTVLSLTGDATVKGDNTWWPVTVAETGSRGWVNQEDITPS